MSETRTSILSMISGATILRKTISRKMILPATILSSFLAVGAVGVRLAAASVAPLPPSQAQTAPAAPSVRHIGAIKAISGTSITLTPDSGPEVNVVVQPTTRLLRIAPGEKNRKNATPLQLQDLQVGDRILVGGQASDDAKSVAASTIVVMARTDLEAHHQQELQDWQKRGMAGLVSAVDPAAGTVTISVSNLMGKKSIVIHTSKDTVIRRYAPDSVKFEDAKTSSLQQIQPGDQLRARGDRNADGTELTAEEIVTGVFRNIVGTINSVDATSGDISIQDVLTKKAVMVKVAGTSELHKLPPETAQRFAMRLKGASGIAGLPGGGGASSGGANSGATGSGANPPAGATGSAAANAPANPPSNTPPGAQSQGAASNAQGAPAAGSAGGAWRGGNGGGAAGAGTRPAGGSDFQQMLSHTPAVAVADLHKGDAVVILATEGTPTIPSTVITLVGGVEAILQAAPSASQAMMLAPWSLGGAPAGEGNP
jgi:hypothetical protein